MKKSPLKNVYFFSTLTLTMLQKYPKDLAALIACLKKLPGVGVKTAERFAFEFLKWKGDDLSSLGFLLKDLLEQVPSCKECGCLTQHGSCHFCQSTRDTSSLCILSSPRDAYAIEETRAYRGLYHVVEHLLSPLDGRHTEQLRVDRILERIDRHQVKEIIIAFDSTLEGDTTALYLKNELSKLSVQVSRLGVGLPMGSSLEYIDGGTLARAFTGRQTL